MDKSFSLRFMFSCFTFFSVVLFLVYGKNVFVGNILKNLPEQSTKVETLLLEKKNWVDISDETGVVKPKNQVFVSAQSMGHIERIIVDTGAIVKKGDPLIQLDDRLANAQLEQASAAYELSLVQFKRATALLQEKTVSQANFDEALASMNQAKARLDQANVSRDYLTVRAPIDGVIDYFDLNPGQFVNIGQPLIQILSTADYEVEFSTSGEFASRITKDRPITVNVSGLNKKAFITEIGQTLSETTRRIMVRARFEDSSSVIPGQYAKIKLTLPHQEKKFVIPEEVVDYSLLGPVVWVVNIDDLTARSVPIKRSLAVDGQVCISSDVLKEGMHLVKKGQLKLYDGSKVSL